MVFRGRLNGESCERSSICCGITLTAVLLVTVTAAGLATAVELVVELLNVVLGALIVGGAFVAVGLIVVKRGLIVLGELIVVGMLIVVVALIAVGVLIVARLSIVLLFCEGSLLQGVSVLFTIIVVVRFGLASKFSGAVLCERSGCFLLLEMGIRGVLIESKKML